jgi:hypothetical protein
VGFVVDKVALGKVFFEYFGFPCQSLFHQILHHQNHPWQVQWASSGRRTEWTQYGLNPPLCEFKNLGRGTDKVFVQSLGKTAKILEKLIGTLLR